MAKTVVEARLGTRAARASLDEGVHWREIDSGTHIHLGYRKGKRGGRWLVRWYQGDQKYRQETLSAADDVLDADGVDTLSYQQAEKAAKRYVTDDRRRVAATSGGTIPTVRDAVEAYIAKRDAAAAQRKGKIPGTVKSDAHRLDKHVLTDADLASTPLYALTKEQLVAWRQGVAGAASSGQRTTNDFRAALRISAPDAQTRELIAEGLDSTNQQAPHQVARDSQILTDEQLRRLLRTAMKHDDDGDVFRMILVLGATGARFSQVARICVQDVQVDASRIIVPASWKGKPSKDKPTIRVPVGSDVIEALRPAMQGRKGSEPLLERWRHEQAGYDANTGRTVWRRKERGGWTSASELTRPFAAIADSAGMSGTIPYALRHTSIVRCLGAGLPIRLVAANHDTSVEMIERHYARHISDALDELAARAVVPLV